MGHTTAFILNWLVAATVLLTLVGAAVHSVRKRAGGTKKYDRVAYLLMRTSPYGVIGGVLWLIVGPVFL